MKKNQDAQTAQDPRDVEIERLRTLVNELTRRNELLQEALRRLQEPTSPTRSRGG